MTLHRYVMVALFLSIPAQAAWTPQEYSSDVASCVATCAARAPTRQECVAYCGCLFDEVRRQFPDHERLRHEIFVQKLPNRIAAFQAIANTCSLRIHGVPANKLPPP